MKDEDGLRFAVPSRPGLLAVRPPGPTGAPDGCEHCPQSSYLSKNPAPSAVAIGVVGPIGAGNVGSFHNIFCGPFQCVDH